MRSVQIRGLSNNRPLFR